MQEELLESFLQNIACEDRPLYQDLAQYLSELGYHPRKQKLSITFKHGLHNKQIAKMGLRGGNAAAPFFALRFSACKSYTERFAVIVREAVQNPNHRPMCRNGCNLCSGELSSHVYQFVFPDGERKMHCGAYALMIPDITEADVAEIKKLLQEEHAYLMLHEAVAPKQESKR